MKKPKNLLISIGITGVLAFILNYIFLPAWNVESTETWIFVLLHLCVFAMILWSLSTYEKNETFSRIAIVSFRVVGVLVVVLILALFFSSKFVNSKRYASMLSPYIVDGDIKDYNATIENVPLLDKESSMLLANRELGSLVDVVSQFEITDIEQITVKGTPVRVTVLEYAGFIKWLNNRNTGTPGYIKLDMRTQEAELVRVDGGIKYSPSEYFSRDLDRYIRFRYPTLMFEESTLELNEEGHPFWIKPIVDHTIGLFGGKDIIGVVLVDAVTGDIQKFNTGEIPEWMDNIYGSELIMEQYDNYGSLQGGIWNYLFGQKGVKLTTDGYNYIPQGNDNYIYTGVTSAGRDESNIGFILANKRTKEVTYYPQSGAEEYSAMSSAEGMVQDLGYVSTFPLLLKIEGQPTYMVALKDAAGLVKMYGMINVERYQIVAIGDTIQSCQSKYRELLRNNGILSTSPDSNIAEGKVQEIKEATKQGTTYYYLKLSNSSKYYSLSILDNEEVILLKVGDSVKLNVESNEDKKILSATLADK